MLKYNLSELGRANARNVCLRKSLRRWSVREVLSFLFPRLRMICEKFSIFSHILCDSGCFFVSLSNFAREIGADWLKWIPLCIPGVSCTSGLILLSVVPLLLDMTMHPTLAFTEPTTNFKINFFQTSSVNPPRMPLSGHLP